MIQAQIDKDEIEFTFPWMTYIVGKARKDDIVKQRTDAIFGDKAGSPYDRAIMFFQYIGNKDVRENLITHEIQEYLDLTFFWDKFGLKPWEVEQCDANWVQDMIMVSNAEGSVKSDRVNEQVSKSKPSGNRPGQMPPGG